jgi:hypothetical protein
MVRAIVLMRCLGSIVVRCSPSHVRLRPALIVSYSLAIPHATDRVRQHIREFSGLRNRINY